MMKWLQKLGKSLMLPVACLPVAGILMGIGYWISPNVMQGGDPTNPTAFIIATFLVKAGAALIDNMPLLFAIGVAIGMSVDREGTSALAGLVSWLMIQQLLNPAVVAIFTSAEANVAFSKVNNQFIGIVCGLIGAYCYNRFKDTKLPDALAFFSGKRSVAIVTGVVSIAVAIVLFFIWPVVYNALVALGTSIIDLGAVGAGVYGFLNRLLIPVGLHHALNSVFWFDIAGINDLNNFLQGTGVRGVTGIYMTGFFPVMMFGMPGAALAIYKTAKPAHRNAVFGLLASAAFCAFFTGVTEPLEFSFMFAAPILYGAHAVLTGISCAVTALLPVRSGFAFSAGAVDWILSFKNPLAVNPWLIVPIGLVVGAIYFFVFYALIKGMNLKTPGREDAVIDDETKVTLANNDFTGIAKQILIGLGGAGNIVTVDNCITRLRLEIKDYEKVDEKAIKAAGVAGVMHPSKDSVQVIVGTQVQFVADELNKLMKM